MHEQADSGPRSQEELARRGIGGEKKEAGHCLVRSTYVGTSASAASSVGGWKRNKEKSFLELLKTRLRRKREREGGKEKKKVWLQVLR